MLIQAHHPASLTALCSILSEGLVVGGHCSGRCQIISRCCSSKSRLWLSRKMAAKQQTIYSWAGCASCICLVMSWGTCPLALILRFRRFTELGTSDVPGPPSDVEKNRPTEQKALSEEVRERWSLQ